MLAYELIDCGNGRKLERFGQYILDRPEPKAVWKPTKPIESWVSQAKFIEKDNSSGYWQQSNDFPPEWITEWNQLKFSLKLTPFKHIGLFPEQVDQWQYIQENLDSSTSFLNLFAYTGAASLAAASVGTKVTHVEASRSTLTWARHNAELSGLAEAPIRWIPEDVPTYLRRLIKRGEKFDAIMLDPPLTGVGSSGQRWQFGRDIEMVLSMCLDILSDKSRFLLLNDYAQARAPKYWRSEIERLTSHLDGTIEAGRLCLTPRSSSAIIETGTWVRWSST